MFKKIYIIPIPITLRERIRIKDYYNTKAHLKMKFSITLLILFLSSCSLKVSNFNSYQRQPISKTSFMPTEEAIEGKSDKVVVFSLEEGDNEVATEAMLGSSMAVEIENILTHNRLAQLVDRNAAKKLEKEIALAEMNKTGSYEGPQIADYAIFGSISDAGFTNKYSRGKVYFDPKEFTMVTIPPRFTYTSTVTGNIKIYELPSMKVADSFKFKAKKFRYESAPHDGGISIAGIINIGGTKPQGIEGDDSLTRKAGEEAIDSISYKVKNFFARKGYILERRSLDGKKNIFKLNIGSEDGIKTGDKFKIIGKYEIENPLTGKIEIEKRVITTGKVSNKINPQSCWIIIDNKKDVNSIRIGDMVQFQYQRGFFDKVSKFIRGFMPSS